MTPVHSRDMTALALTIGPLFSLKNIQNTELLQPDPDPLFNF